VEGQEGRGVETGQDPGQGEETEAATGHPALAWLINESTFRIFLMTRDGKISKIYFEKKVCIIYRNFITFWKLWFIVE